MAVMKDDTIVKVERARLTGKRPRKNGCNARLGEHGIDVAPPIARITLDDGSSGFGWSRIEEVDAEILLGRRFSDLFDPASGTADQARAVDFPFWDLAGRRAGKPVHAMVDRGFGRKDGALTAECYDTSLYMDDLAIADDREAAALIASHAAEGLARGHASFKIKVGRGAMHMEPEEGTRRDIAVVMAVRETIGPTGKINIDANNGYTLNLAKRVISETAPASLYFVEELFHEDRVLYENLKNWLSREGIAVKIADGEGDASPRLLEWARNGIVDIIQYDLRDYGFTRWLALGSLLDSWGIGSAPHNYGDPTANYCACHLAAAVLGFECVEWDEAAVDGLSAPGYTLENGYVSVPDTPGFGLELDEKLFRRRVEETGFSAER